MPSATKKLRASLSLESLEDRLALSVTSASLSNGMIFLNCNNAASNVTVSQNGSSIVVRDATNDFSRSFSSANVNKVQFVGGAGNDRFVNNVSWLPVQCWGMGGNDYLEGYNGADTLVGGAGNDILKGYGGNDNLWGDAGHDELYGGSGNDNLYGGAGNDKLFGGEGKDFLSGQAGTDFFEGGSGHDRYRDDFNLNRWVVGGYSRFDIVQGNSGTCVINAAMAEAADHLNLSTKVTRSGNTFKVRLIDGGKFVYIPVTFDGSWHDNDSVPGQSRKANGTPSGWNNGEFWTILYQRAFLKLCGTNTSNENDEKWTSSKYNFRDHQRALYALSGWKTSQRNISSSTSTAVAQAMRNDILAGHMMTAGGTGHAYSVKDVYQSGGVWYVKLYNPWGVDDTHQTMTFSNGAKSNDGEIILTWNTFRNNFALVYTAKR